MQCEQFQERLQTVLDDRKQPTDDADLLAHADRCVACAAALRFSSQLGQLWSTRDEGIALNQTTVETTKANHDKTTSFLMWAAISVVAASCLLAWWLPRLDTQHTIQVASNDQAIFSVDVANGSPTDADSHAQVVQSNLDPSQSPFVHQPLISIGLLSRQPWEYSMDEVQIPFAASLPTIGPDWIDAVSDGMAPVQESVNKTLGAIRRSISS